MKLPDSNKQATGITGAILGDDDSTLMTLARSIALYHHEKWDGSGYPKGIKGEDIPIEARIVALADVFDALTSERPYKKAWAVEDAVALIEKERGHHFDPDIVDAFLQSLPELLAIKDQWQQEAPKS